MKYYVYVIQSEKDGSLYKGLTNNLERRLKQHNQNKSQSTKGKSPYRLVYFEECLDRIEARIKEKYFKSGVGREFLKRTLKI
ncbi:MAG: GIY-YIG nuclease family protein [Candidatus Daviesbacteria bacterium]|nr:GIY-YIG nuclease family protein [Candidatus Daviesbacteria bacterium]